MTKDIRERVLDVYWDTSLVGKLLQKAAGQLSFIYDPSFLATAKIGISISLPLQTEAFEGDVVKAFFSGLLPEESVKLRLAKSIGVSNKNTFALLEAVGGDCAGALSLLTHGQQPAPITMNAFEVLDDAHLDEILKLMKRRPFLLSDGLRLSLAGAQDKLAVGYENGQIRLMKGGQPTTHILKPIIEHVTDSVQNEFFCMRLAKQVGLDVPDANIHYVNQTPYYIVQRYDRIKQPNGNVVRIHQEDFCQALGIVPELKYEREGGPNVLICQQLLNQHVMRPAADQTKLTEILIFNYLIGNNDAHGKNFSLVYHATKPALAPAYDLLSTAIYADLSAKMAMKIGGKYDADGLFMRHWLRIVPETRAAHAALQKQLKSLALHTVENALILKAQLEAQGLRSPVFQQICRLIEKRCKRILS